MSDFRVRLPTAGFEFTDRELDWSQARRIWRRSEKARGSVTWFLDLDPEPADVIELKTFFCVADGAFDDLVLSLSPAELSVVHAQQNEVVRVRAELCAQCGAHWHIYKSEGNQWTRYGRTCDSSWTLNEPTS